MKDVIDLYESVAAKCLRCGKETDRANSIDGRISRLKCAICKDHTLHAKKLSQSIKAGV